MNINTSFLIKLLSPYGMLVIISALPLRSENNSCRLNNTHYMVTAPKLSVVLFSSTHRLLLSRPGFSNSLSYPCLPFWRAHLLPILFHPFPFITCQVHYWCIIVQSEMEFWNKFSYVKISLLRQRLRQWVVWKCQTLWQGRFMHYLPNMPGM